MPPQARIALRACCRVVHKQPVWLPGQPCACPVSLQADLGVLICSAAHPLYAAQVLGPLDLTFLGLGSIIGAGVFVLSGVAARELAG